MKRRSFKECTAEEYDIVETKELHAIYNRKKHVKSNTFWSRVYVRIPRKEKGVWYKTIKCVRFRDISHGFRRRQIYRWYNEHTYRNVLNILYNRNIENVRKIMTVIE